jgi:hypothetical protein
MVHESLAVLLSRPRQGHDTSAKDIAALSQLAIECLLPRSFEAAPPYCEGFRNECGGSLPRTIWRVNGCGGPAFCSVCSGAYPEPAPLRHRPSLRI